MKQGTFLLIVILALVLVFSVTAQEGDAPAGFREGAPIIEPNFGADIKTLNPIIVQDGASQDVIQRMYPSLIGADPLTIAWAPDVSRALADSWDISDDGAEYTFTLSQDWVWSDGTPVTAQDIVYFWEVTENPDTPTPLSRLVDNVQLMEAVDDYTLRVVFEDASCTALDDLNGVYAVPRHIYEDAFQGDYADMEANDLNLNMPVSAGDFVFANFRPGEQVTLLANPDYPDAVFGHVIPEGWVYKTVTDQVVQMEQFFAGDISFVDSVPQAFVEEVQERAEAGEFQIFASPSITIRFLAFNLADPTNPQNAFDEDGNAIDQGQHPIFGDVRVRQALAYTVPFDAINEAVFFGTGIQTASHVLPTSWAFNADVQPYPYDPEQAMSLLEDAGWTDEDGDGIRECHGCLYAEEGAPLSFRLETNAGNVSQEALYTVLQDEWKDIGVDAQFAVLDFNLLVEALTGQTFDAIGLFWVFSVPDNPNDTADTFTPDADIVGAGFNASSYNNPRVTELLDQARTLPGCSTEERAKLYGEVQAILRDEVPWLWIGASTVTLAAQADIENWDPMPGASRWNIDGWYTEPR